MGAENRVEISELRRAADAHDGEIVTGLDRFGRVVDHYWANFNTSTITDEFVYGYDRNSNRLYRDNVLDSTFGELYAYDNFDQLSDFARGTLSTTSDSIVGMPVRSQNWDPDPLGNAASIATDGTPESRTYNAQNQFDTVGGNPLDYDNNDNLILDQNGNVYIYDAWNRLVRVEDSMSTLLTAYSYNALNRRIIEDDGSTETHLFYSANWQVLEEQVASDTTVQYVWSPVYIDAMILRDRDTDSDGDTDERLYVQQDANFNVTALVDTSGVVVQRYVQDPFGLVTDVLNVSWATTTDAFEWKYLHQGLRFDAQVDKYDNRMRIYDPVLQRFIQVDTSGFDAGDANLFRYIGNNPANATDPIGLDSKKQWQDKATAELGNPQNEFDRNTQITAAYARLYSANQNAFAWAGLAAFASEAAGEAMDRARQLIRNTNWVALCPLAGNTLVIYMGITGTPTPGTIGAIVAKGNVAIYDDMYWHHLAYKERGIKEIKSLFKAGDLPPDVYTAWLCIDDGETKLRQGKEKEGMDAIWKGAELMTKYEQEHTAQKNIHDQFPSEMRWIGDMVPSPLPANSGTPNLSFRAGMPNGNFANFKDRWTWVQSNVLPDWRSFVEQKPNAVKGLQTGFANKAK